MLIFLLNWKTITVVLFIFYIGLSSPAISYEDRYTTSLPNFKETIPRKVNEDGVFVSHFIPHFYETNRKKRDTGSEQLHYIIPVDGIDHHVTLRPSSDFISPGMVVETHYLKENKSHIAVRQVRSTQCHYNGFVKGINNSRATLSTCYGLAGHILVPNEQYLIEPSLNTDRKDEYHVHYIYKRSEMKTANNVTNCGTKGKFREALKERMEYERKYGYKIERSVRNVFQPDNMYLENTEPRHKRTHQDFKREEYECSDDVCPPPEDHIPPLRPPRFLEILIVVDYRVDKSFTHDLEAFIFTVFNMVVSNFHDQTVGTTLHLKLIRLIYLGYTLPRLDVSRYAPSVLLENFCDWQLEVNPYLETHPNHHDFSIFITRFQPCQEKILGLTHMASVCRLDKGCTVVSEEGLLLANIITHQIGHSLGADHDDSESGGCAGIEPDGTRYHMNPVITLSSSEWSICSQHCLVEFINTRISWCMTDPPDEHDFRQPDILPGQVYDAIHQCSINFRMNTLACKTGELCKELFCQITPTKCASTGDPPALGTPCAKDMWCFNGKCVHRGQRPGAINGEWGPWTSWSGCTRSCGGGVQSRYRSCDQPAPYHGGTYCFGEWVTYRMCNFRMCQGYAPSFREMQCKMTDKRPYKGHMYAWDQFRTFFEEMSCALICINDHKEVSVRSPVVIDGTPCEPGTNNICIQGNCRRVGCDNVIDSESKEDGCGKCHGNGTGCTIIEGFFKEPDIEGIVPVLKLPIGTSMIYVRELEPSSCFMIIGSSINSKFFLNNPTRFEDLPGQFNCGGADGVYETKLNMERIFVSGAIKTPITLSLSCKDQKNPGLHYQYALPEVELHHSPTYVWIYLYWDECSAICGGGIQRSRPVCVETRSGEVDDKYCYDKVKPDDITRTCNSRHCSSKWWVGSWSNCDCKNGEGIMTRVVLCMKIASEDGTISKVTKDKECCNEPKPRIQKPCSEQLVTNVLQGRVRIKREKQMNENKNYNNDFLEPDHELHEKEEHWEQDLDSEDVDYGDHFNPRFKEPTFSFEDDMNSSYTMIYPKKKKIRRKNRKKVHNRAHPLLQMGMPFEEKEGFPTKKKIFTSGIIQPKLIDEIESENIIKNIERKKEEILTTAYKVNSNETTATLLPIVTDIKAGLTYKSSIPTFTTPKNNSQFLSDLFTEYDVITENSSCIPRDDMIEPADLWPRLDTGNNSAYKLVVVPILPNSDIFPLTDYEIRVFGDSGYWPIVSRNNQVLIYGEKMFKIINEASRRATKPPFIELDSD